MIQELAELIGYMFIGMAIAFGWIFPLIEVIRLFGG